VVVVIGVGDRIQHVRIDDEHEATELEVSGRLVGRCLVKNFFVPACDVATAWT
jgi:hypothetical protein